MKMLSPRLRGIFKEALYSNTRDENHIYAWRVRGLFTQPPQSKQNNWPVLLKKTILKGSQSENLKDFHLKLKEVSQFYNKMPTGSSSAKDQKDCLRYYSS